VYGDEDDADTSRKARTDAVDFNTVRHWLKYSEQGEEEAAATAAAGAERPRPVYRELVDDVDEDLDDVDDGLVHRHDAERPSDAVVHVHHVHEVDDHAVSVVEASKSSPTATVALEGLVPATDQLPNSADDERPPRNDDNHPTGGRHALKYNVEEGQLPLQQQW